MTGNMNGFNEQKLFNADNFLYSSNWRTELPKNKNIAPDELLQEVLKCDVGMPSDLLASVTNFTSNEDGNVAKYELLTSLSVLIRNKRRFHVLHHVKEAFKRNGLVLPDKQCEDPVPMKVVLTYVSNALAKILPLDIVGNNNRRLQKLARELIKGKPIVTVGQVVAHLHKGTYEDEGWLRSVPDRALQSYLAASLAVWIATKLTPELVKAAFYGCKHDANNVPVFFTKPCWQSRSERVIETLVNDGVLRQVPHVASIKLPALKLVPKTVGVRCVLQYKKQSIALKENEKEQNTVFAIKEIINNITGRPQNLSQDWITFRNNFFVQMKSTEPLPIYFVYADLSNAYGTVKQEKVYEIFNEKLQSLPSTIKVSSVNQETKYSLDLQTLKTLKSSFKTNKTVIVNKSDVEDLVKSVVWQQKAVFGRKRTFHMTKGIGQGHVLTNSLCNLALHHFYQTLAEFNQPHNSSVLFRASDDFLLLSFDRDIASRFVIEFKEKAVNYGWKVNVAKLDQNLDNPDLYWADFNGISFNLREMEVHPIFSSSSRVGIYRTLRKPKPGDLDTIEMFWEVVAPLRLLKVQPLLFSCPESRRISMIIKVSSVARFQAMRIVAGFSTFGLNSATLRVATKQLEALAALVLLWMHQSSTQCLRLVEVTWIMLLQLELKLRYASDLPVKYKMHVNRMLRRLGRLIKPDLIYQLVDVA